MLEKKNTAGILVTNSFYSILSKLIPILISILSIPIIIHKLGDARFGILTIAWVFIGYFNLFDLGIGKALTKLIAEKTGTEKENISSLLYSALQFTFLLGLFAAILFLILAEPIVKNVLNIEQILLDEVLRALAFLAIGIPFTIVINSLKGALEAVQEFKAITNIQIFFGAVTYGGLILIVQFSVALPALIFHLSLVKIVQAFFLFHICNKVLKLTKPAIFERRFFKPLFIFGGWVTVSNIVSPLMVAIDRIVIGAKQTMAEVAYYSTPNDMIQRLGILPSSVVLVLFPFFSKNSKDDAEINSRIYSSSFSLLLLGSTLGCLILIMFAEDLLHLWINQDFASSAFVVLQIISVGALYNFVARVPLTIIQGKGRPDITAKFHLLELPIYLFLLYYLTTAFGITGAAIATSVRMIFDFLLLHFYTVKYYRFKSHYLTLIIGTVLPVLLGFYISDFDFLLKIVSASFLLILLTLYFWLLVFEKEMKSFIINRYFKKVKI